MNRRECLKALAALGANLVLPASAIESASQKNIDSAWQALQSSSTHGLADHPRIMLLRNDVLSLPVDEEYKNLLLQSIAIYREHIIKRPVYAPNEGWDDLEAIQQVTLADMGARWFKEQAENEAKLEREVDEWILNNYEPLPHHKLIDIQRRYISRWLQGSREARKSSIKGYVTATAAKEVHRKGNQKRFPGIYFRSGPVGGRSPIPENATKDEILAQAMLKAMDRARVLVAFSEAKTINITSSNSHAQLDAEYPYIAAFNRFLKYPADTTKEALIGNAASIAATWCPGAYLAWSSTEIIYPKKS
ncbi:MAG TPA: hypothetical protein PK580_09130 [Nitrosomonas halophila]|nr:hypothetical protein [Nitrosomonas halophila]